MSTNSVESPLQIKKMHRGLDAAPHLVKAYEDMDRAEAKALEFVKAAVSVARASCDDQVAAVRNALAEVVGDMVLAGDRYDNQYQELLSQERKGGGEKSIEQQKADLNRVLAGLMFRSRVNVARRVGKLSQQEPSGFEERIDDQYRTGHGRVRMAVTPAGQAWVVAGGSLRKMTPQQMGKVRSHVNDGLKEVGAKGQGEPVVVDAHGHMLVDRYRGCNTGMVVSFAPQDVTGLKQRAYPHMHFHADSRLADVSGVEFFPSEWVGPDLETEPLVPERVIVFPHLKNASGEVWNGRKTTPAEDSELEVTFDRYLAYDPFQGPTQPEGDVAAARVA